MMSRFQAITNPVLDEDLEVLRQCLGLRPGQKAELLRELTSLASWVVDQADAGRCIEARQGDRVESLVHPAVERLRQAALREQHSGAICEASRSGVPGTEEGVSGDPDRNNDEMAWPSHSRILSTALTNRNTRHW